jgi:type II secretory pathway component PulM
MTMTRRERYIAIATAAVVALLVLDWLVLSPWFEARDRVSTQLTAAREELNRSQQVFQNLNRANRRWADVSGGALATSASAAEGQTLNALRDWAQASGLALSAMRPDRGEAAHGFQQVTIRVTGAGRMEQIVGFLDRIDAADTALRLSDVQFTTRRPGVDDLSVQLAVSTIFLPPQPVEGRAP